MKRFFILVAMAAMASCNRESLSTTIINDTLHGVTYEVDHFSGPALSRSRDKVYVTKKGERQLIFFGYGARDIVIRTLKEGIIIIDIVVAA